MEASGSDVNDISSQIHLLAEKIQQSYFAVLNQLVFKLFFDLIASTPVDTGRARASWRISLNVADTSVEPPRDKKVKSSLTVGSPPTAEEAQALRAVLAQFKWGDTIVISNNLDYILVLESGSGSDQAPQGMARAAVARMIEGLNSAVAAVQ